MAGNGWRVGVIGVGFGTRVHVPAFQSEDWEVAAICSRTQASVAKAAEEHGIPHVFTDYRELIASPDVDAVAVVTPPVSHEEITLAALAAGKHVLCEKPMAMSTAEAVRMRDAADQRGLTAMIAHEFRFTPQRAHVKMLIDDGFLGDVETLSVTASLGHARGTSPGAMRWQSEAGMGGGQLAGIGSHYIDSLRYWLGDVAVVADTDDAFSLRLRFARGTECTFSYTSHAPVSLGVTTHLHGTEGWAEPGPGVGGARRQEGRQGACGDAPARGAGAVQGRPRRTSAAVPAADPRVGARDPLRHLARPQLRGRRGLPADHGRGPRVLAHRRHDRAGAGVGPEGAA
jgi:predicted dehydrogenase